MKAVLPILSIQLLLSLFLPTATNAENITIHEVIHEQQYHPIEHETSSPFLSATLKTDISPVSGAVSQYQIDSLSSVLVSFLTKVFDEQQVYDVAIVGVAIFEESLHDISVDNSTDNIDNNVPSSRNGKRTRKLALSALQAGQFHFNEDDPNTRLKYEAEEDFDDDGSWDEQPWDDETLLLEDQTNSAMLEEESSNGSTDIDGSSDDGGAYYTLSFATIVSAEHTQHQSLSHTEFQTMLVHVCSKFEDHMVEYVTGIDDTYFENVESVIVSGYEEEESSDNDAVENGIAADGLNNPEEEEESKRLSGAASIVGIAVVAILLLVLSVILSMKLIAFYRGRSQQRQQHKTNDSRRWRTQEITTHNNNVNNAMSIKSLSILYSKPHEDDFSFNPLCTDNGYNGKTSFDYDNANESFDDDSSHLSFPKISKSERTSHHRHHGNSAEETVSFVGNQRQHLTPLPNATDMIAFPPRQPSSSSSSSPMAKLKQEHVFAPPGKVGVAIDVVNGQPVVHKVKKGSPLEGLLHKNDLVLAIDDVDTTRMSAADVTSLMVKRMNYGRKITFVRA